MVGRVRVVAASMRKGRRTGVGDGAGVARYSGRDAAAICPCILVTARQSEDTYSPAYTLQEACGALKWGCTCSLDSFDSRS